MNIKYDKNISHSIILIHDFETENIAKHFDHSVEFIEVPIKL